MSVIVTDPVLGVWEMGEEQPLRLPCDLSWPCVPCAGTSCMAVCCARTRECLCLKKQTGELVSSMPAPPGVTDMCLSPCERYLYQLSAEADCIHTRCTATGELLFAAPAGVFPRMMRLDRAGRLLLSAGGSVNEASLLDARTLVCERVIATKHACFAADFWSDGLVLVCAAEGEDIQTVIYTLRPRSVRPRRLLALPGQPGTLCVCPDGVTALVSTPDGLMRLSLRTGELLWNRTEWPLCMRVSCRGQLALVSDTLDGRVALFHLDRPWEKRVLCTGTAAQACFA